MSFQRTRFDRVLLKLSGEAFGGSGVGSAELASISQEIINGCQVGAQLAVVVGGGNIIRGSTLAEHGQIHPATADYMGMLGTVINGLALREALERAGQPARCMTALDIPSVAEPFIRGRALRHMEKGRVVVLAAGTGNPFFTTDTCAALRATELECQAVLKATKVDGVYTADPGQDASATRYDTITFTEAIEKQLGVMDMTALTMCQERRIPIIVFDFRNTGAIRSVLQAEPVGTVIHNA